MIFHLMVLAGTWAKPDASQQEFRLLVHYAHQHKLRKAEEAVEL